MWKKCLTIILTLVFSCFGHADFTHQGSGKLFFPTGTETPLDFGFAFNKTDYGYTFKAGSQEMEVAQLPEKYSLWLSMNKDEQVFIQEFARSYLTEFEWQLAEHTISLKKKVLSPKRAKGDYVLTIGNIDYFFKANQGQIDILFNEDGISSVEIGNGFIADLGMMEE